MALHTFANICCENCRACYSHFSWDLYVNCKYTSTAAWKLVYENGKHQS